MCSHIGLRGIGCGIILYRCARIALQDVCSILVLTITRSSGVIRDQLVSLLLVLPPIQRAPREQLLLSSHLHVIFESASFVTSREKHNLAVGRVVYC